MDETTPTFRVATLEDAGLLTTLGYNTFWDTFHDHPKNKIEDVIDYVNEVFTLSRTTTEIQDVNSTFILAEMGNEIVGYAKLLEWSKEEGIIAEHPMELCRFYVLRNYWGKGIASMLMDECFRITKNKHCDEIWLGVWELNPRAQAFYRKQGFEVVGEHVFVLGSDPQIDLLMQRHVDYSL